MGIGGKSEGKGKGDHQSLSPFGLRSSLRQSGSAFGVAFYWHA
jgi:hypothetical protein